MRITPECAPLMLWALTLVGPKDGGYQHQHRYRPFRHRRSLSQRVSVRMKLCLSFMWNLFLLLQMSSQASLMTNCPFANHESFERSSLYYLNFLFLCTFWYILFMTACFTQHIVSLIMVGTDSQMFKKYYRGARSSSNISPQRKFWKLKDKTSTGIVPVRRY